MFLPSVATYSCFFLVVEERLETLFSCLQSQRIPVFFLVAEERHEVCLFLPSVSTYSHVFLAAGERLETRLFMPSVATYSRCFFLVARERLKVRFIHAFSRNMFLCFSHSA